MFWKCFYCKQTRLSRHYSQSVTQTNPRCLVVLHRRSGGLPASPPVQLPISHSPWVILTLSSAGKRRASISGVWTYPRLSRIISLYLSCFFLPTRDESESIEKRLKRVVAARFRIPNFFTQLLNYTTGSRPCKSNSQLEVWAHHRRFWMWRDK